MNKYCCGQEVASLVLSSDLVNLSWSAILECGDPGVGAGIVFKSYPYPDKNATIVAFVTSPACALEHLQTHGCDLISSEQLTALPQAPLFDFLSTKLNPSFRIHRAAISLFASIIPHLSQLLNNLLCNGTQLIMTGNSLGGSVASLFTLWLLDSLSSNKSSKDNKKHPLCITFGSPLLGDHSFQQSISERPSWNQCFLHLLYNHDPILSTFISQQTPVYKPFGIFLLFTHSNCLCFEQPEATLESIIALINSQLAHRNNTFQIIDYGPILRQIQSETLAQGTSSLPWNLCVTPLQAGITIQLQAIGVDMQNSNSNSVVTNTERILSRASKRSPFDPTKKLNEMKKDMIFFEWYKKSMVEEGGYYDSFKNVQFQSGDKIISRQEIIKHKKILERYWKRMVEEVEKMPQKEGIAFRTRWLYAGTNYRRMVEPLDIAEYYRDEKREYRDRGRSKHYLMLEKWMNEDKPGGVGSSNNTRNKAVSLTEDSCFWAGVEEALISCKVLGDGQSSIEDKKLSRNYLVGFEDYVMRSIRSYSVSSEIFLKKSTFMHWWLQYKEINQPSSSFTEFMKNNEYRTYVCDEYRAYV